MVYFGLNLRKVKWQTMPNIVPNLRKTVIFSLNLRKTVKDNILETVKVN
jgi:hypothetical protein